MIVGVRHTGVVVRDLARMKLFYESLGFEEVISDTESGEFIEQERY